MDTELGMDSMAINSYKMIITLGKGLLPFYYSLFEKAARMREPKKEVIKHSAAIQISSHITLLQRRMWNVLLANAYDELPTEEKHHVRIAELIRVLEFDSKNDGYLKEALRALVGCRVE